jgi:uncharacterized protein (TIGR03067 family)
MNSLEGTWQPVYAELDGEEAPRMALEKMELQLSGGKYTVLFGGEAYDHGTCEVSADGLTLCGIRGPNAGRTIPSIFKFSGDVLSICYGLSGKRPVKFATGSGQQIYLVNYQRKEK